jgi:predicted NAD/FAD-binding protein
MSFAASIDDGQLEYGLGLAALAGQRRNLVSPLFYGMIRDILRFNARSRRGEVAEHVTLAEYLDELRLGRWFRDYYLTPFCGAIWSTPPRRMLDFPAAALVRFFRNHHLLNTLGQHQWWTVSGGAATYVTRLVHHLEQHGVEIRCGAPVRHVERRPDGVWLRVHGGLPERFDQVVFASHPDQSLGMIADPSHDERRLLSAIGYQDNRMVLHSDPAHMPRRRNCWSSWVYRARLAEERPGIGVTYWMNRLQNIPENDPLFVTLNPSDPIPQDAIYDETSFHHPVFDEPAIRAQDGIAAIQGRNRTWYAGAWLRNGFHEDGLASAVRIARRMGVPAW